MIKIVKLLAVLDGNRKLYPDSTTKVAVLATCNTSQGAYNAIIKFSPEVRLFYRKTMNEFKSEIHEFDIIINRIKVNKPNEHIIFSFELMKVKKNALLLTLQQMQVMQLKEQEIQI